MRGGRETCAGPGRRRFRAHDTRLQSFAYREVAGCDRPRAYRRMRFPGPGRADRQPAGRRSRAVVHRVASPAGQGRGDDLCVAPARRDIPDCGSGCRVARRQNGRHARHRSHQSGRPCQPDCRTQGARNQPSGSSGRPGSPLRERPVHRERRPCRFFRSARRNARARRLARCRSRGSRPGSLWPDGFRRRGPAQRKAAEPGHAA